MNEFVSFWMIVALMYDIHMATVRCVSCLCVWVCTWPIFIQSRCVCEYREWASIHNMKYVTQVYRISAAVIIIGWKKMIRLENHQVNKWNEMSSWYTNFPRIIIIIIIISHKLHTQLLSKNLNCEFLYSNACYIWYCCYHWILWNDIDSFFLSQKKFNATNVKKMIQMIAIHR